ncbi:class I SAM-dependent methyltransferase [Pedobacter soli]|uniref:Methyltransferase domain-containing protein n=1 Tax=Pedobacter soli TaxID=390242 RepID=A0A1G6PJD8_9SPHI|nr:class I SAM-dependent methyltransferase [Pedobacter soli]SDC79636.1 Methyltransferase domain-containing protein [Pedobacter soli]
MLRLKYYFQKPQSGFDPVPKAFAEKYAANEYSKVDSSLVDAINTQVADLRDKSILDLGAGPGQYSIEFAKKGAKVTWHDISQNYLEIAKNKANAESIAINFSLGYLEEAEGKYDMIFNRICWYYCINDNQFATRIYNLVKKDGFGFIVVNNEKFLQEELKKESGLKKMLIRFSYWINENFNIKLTHVHPSHQKLSRIFARLDFKSLQVERNGHNTLITFNK